MSLVRQGGGLTDHNQRPLHVLHIPGAVARFLGTHSSTAKPGRATGYPPISSRVRAHAPQLYCLDACCSSRSLHGREAMAAAETIASRKSPLCTSPARGTHARLERACALVA